MATLGRGSVSDRCLLTGAWLALLFATAALVAGCGSAPMTTSTPTATGSASSTTEPIASPYAPSESPTPLVWDEAQRVRACWAYSLLAEAGGLTAVVETALAEDDLDTAYMAATTLQAVATELFGDLDSAGLGEPAASAWRQLWAASDNLRRYARLVTEGIVEGNERKTGVARVLVQRGMSQVATAAQLRVALETSAAFTCSQSGYPRVELPEPPVILPLGTTGQVYTDNLRLRSNPWIGDQSVKYVPTLDAGTRFTFLNGPVFGSGFWWYRVRLLFTTLDGGVTEGWLASASRDGCEWIDVEGAVDPGCP